MFCESYGKCVWGPYKIMHTNQAYGLSGEGNRYHFKVSDALWGDTFITWNEWRVYDFQTKKTDTILDAEIDIDFKVKGKYLVSFVIWSDYGQCDTALTDLIQIQYFNKYCLNETHTVCNQFDYSLCELNKDTCIEYYFGLFHGPALDYIDSLYWDSASSINIALSYQLPRSELDTVHSFRTFHYEYPEDGRYFLVTEIFNRCSMEDTLVYQKVNIDCKGASVKNLIKKENKVIGIYDVLGRPVQQVENNVPYIYLYDNGQRKKILIINK